MRVLRHVRQYQVDLLHEVTRTTLRPYVYIYIYLSVYMIEDEIASFVVFLFRFVLLGKRDDQRGARGVLPGGAASGAEP